MYLIKRFEKFCLILFWLSQISERNSSCLFKKWLVRRPNGGCQVLFSWYELDDFVDEIIKTFKIYEEEEK